MTDARDDVPPGISVPDLRGRLLAEREVLVAANAASADSRDPVELDQTSVGRLSRMDAMQQQAMALATQRRRASALLRIDAALSRIAAGDYGWCATCGESIAPGRLAQDPATPYCVVCAARPNGR